MIVGIPKEIKLSEGRVALTPSGVAVLVTKGHSVLVEARAGVMAGFPDAEYQKSGARVVSTAAEAWSAELVVKVKEPIEEEYRYFHEGLILFTYLHLAAERALAEALTSSGVTGIAYETVRSDDGSLPLLAPMSAIAGRMSVQVGAQCLESAHGGKGILLGGVPGVESAKVTIIGGGIVGTNAAHVALGMGAQVKLIEQNPRRLRDLDEVFRGRAQVVMTSLDTLANAVEQADLVIGAVLVPGALAPKPVTETMVREMSPGAVIVDVAVDQGGSVETVDRPTTHEQPTYLKHGVLHYAVANMPGAVARTSTLALTNATLPYVMALAKMQGNCEYLTADTELGRGVNTHAGRITCRPVAESLGMARAA